MSQKEIFNTKSWNFLFGDRSVEGILRELPPQTNIVVRNHLGAILPTIAGIRDIELLGWQEPLKLNIIVPSNAIVCDQPKLYDHLEEKEFYPTLLQKIYGVGEITSMDFISDIKTLKKRLIVILNTTEENFAIQGKYCYCKDTVNNIEYILNQVSQTESDVNFIFTVPTQARLISVLRRYALQSFTSLHWNGKNAFSLSTFEEAVLDVNPDEIIIVGVGTEEVFYTAIGAVDFFINQDAKTRDPRTLDRKDLLSIGNKVKVLSDCVPYNYLSSRKESVISFVKSIMSNGLKVKSTEQDFRFTATEQSIAIDIL